MCTCWDKRWDFCPNITSAFCCCIHESFVDRRWTKPSKQTFDVWKVSFVVAHIIEHIRMDIWGWVEAACSVTERSNNIRSSSLFQVEVVPTTTSPVHIAPWRVCSEDKMECLLPLRKFLYFFLFLKNKKHYLHKPQELVAELASVTNSWLVEIRTISGKFLLVKIAKNGYGLFVLLRNCQSWQHWTLFFAFCISKLFFPLLFLALGWVSISSVFPCISAVQFSHRFILLQMHQILATQNRLFS